MAIARHVPALMLMSVLGLVSAATDARAQRRADAAVAAGPAAEEPGAVTAVVRVAGRGGAPEAQVHAVRTLLFVGIPGTNVSQPLVPDEAAARTAHPGYFEQLLERRGYAPYIIRTVEVAGPGDEGGARWLVTINHVALLTALEQRGVIRRPGL